MRTPHRLAAGLITLSLLTAACGSDDEDSSSPDTTAADSGDASGDNVAFCDGVVDLNNALLQAEIGSDTPEDEVKAAGEQLVPLSQALVDEAPEGLEDGAAEVHGFVEPLKDGDAAAFDDESTFETYLGFLGEASAECEFAEVEVTGKDYAFEAPDTIEAGTVSFAFTNASDAEEHEMILFTKAPGVDLSFEELLDLPEEESEEKVVFIGATFAPPGESSSALATLEPGEYAMVCFIPVGGGEDGPPHYEQGMFHEFTVE
jgi:uncharacterized cupredoxin-like copper-binding protein